MDRNTSSLPDFLTSPLESLRLSLSSLPSSPSSISSSPPPPPLLTPAHPSLLQADVSAYIAGRQQYSRALTNRKAGRALHTLHSESLSQLLGNERQQQRAVASMVARSGVVSGVESGLVGGEREAAVMDGLLGELVVRLKALDGVMARLPPVADYNTQAESELLQR